MGNGNVNVAPANSVLHVLLPLCKNTAPNDGKNAV